MQYWLGIDPGNKGAMCLLPKTGQPLFIDNNTTPNTIVDILTKYKIDIAMIEDVHSIYGVSAKSNFNFGFNVGYLHGIISALKIPLDVVQPKVWQKHFNVKVTGKNIKKEVASIALRLNPTLEIYGSKGGLLDGRSDAYLIAMYAKFKHK